MPDPLLDTARRAAGDGFEILGELGRSGDQCVAYLARESPTGELVALTLEAVPAAAGSGDSSFAVRRALDRSVPAAGSSCPVCSAATETWARYCASCRFDLSGGPPPVEDKNTGRMLAQTAARGRFDLLGDMARAEGGSPVYFGRDEESGDLVALRLEPMDDPEAPVPFTLSVTQRVGAVDGESESAAPESTATEEGPATTGRIYVCPLCEAQYPGGTFFCPRDGTALRPKVRTKDLVGQTIAGRYRIVERLGQGGMGQVYKAVHVRMGSHCAIKIMNPALETDPEALGRFAREATLASRIDHPNVARVYDFGETENGLLFLAMEFVEGDSLSAILADQGRLAPHRAAELAWQVADALSAAHDLGTVHRDIKPDNIIVNRSRGDREKATVVDFGIAKGIEVSENEQVTRAGFVVGNPKYMSPEQLIGEATDARGDVYSLGCVLYEMLVGEPAFSGATGAALLTQRLTEPAPSARKKVASVPAALDAIVVRALERERDDRFSSAIEMRDALDAFIASTPGRVSTDRQRAFGPVSAQQTPTPTPAPAPQVEAPTPPAAAPPERPARKKVPAPLPEPVLGTAAKPAPPRPGGPIPVPRKAGQVPRRPPTRLLVAGAVIVVAILAALFWPRGPASPAPGILVIQGALPAGSIITAQDGEGAATTVDGGSVQLAAGPYRIFFEAPGHQPDEGRIVIEPGGSADWTPRILPLAIDVAVLDDTAGAGTGGGAVSAEQPEAAGASSAAAGSPQRTGGGQAPGGAQPTVPVWSAARADSVAAIIDTARRQASAGQFAQATRSLGAAENRVRSLRATFPGQAALSSLDRQIREVRDSVARLQQPVAPRFRQSSADSIGNLLTAAEVRAERREYGDAFQLLTEANIRIAALRSTFPDEPALDALARQVTDATTQTRTVCEAWRQIQLERGLPAPVCR